MPLSRWFARTRAPRRAGPVRLRLEALESLIVPAGVRLYACSTGPGIAPEVKVYNADGTLRWDIFPYDPRFLGGVHVATGDVNGDGLDDFITAPGQNGGPDVKVYDGFSGNLIFEFNAYDPGFRGGVFVAAADINKDGHADIVTGAGPGGGPHVQVFNGTQLNLTGADGRLQTTALLDSFFAYDSRFTGGVTVAAGDINGDGRVDIVTGAGPGGGPHVRVIDSNVGIISTTAPALKDLFAFDPNFRGGVFVAAGDTRGVGVSDIVVGAGVGGGPNVTVYRFTDQSLAPLRSFFAYDPLFRGGVRVATTDINNDGRAEIVTGPGQNGGPDVRVFDSVTVTILREFLSFSPTFIGGIFVG